MLKSKTKKIMAAAVGMLLVCNVAAAETAELQTVTKAGSNATVQANPKNFTGTAWVTSLFSANSPSKTYAAVVSFTPGARTNWHIQFYRSVADRYRRFWLYAGMGQGNSCPVPGRRCLVSAGRQTLARGFFQYIDVAYCGI